MANLLKKRLKKEPSSNFREFIENLKKEKERVGGKIDIAVLDQGKLERRCGRSYLSLFKTSLIEVTWDRFLFIFEEKEKRSSWYSENWDKVVINFSRALVKEELEKAVRVAQEIKVVEEKLKKERIKKG